MTRFGLMLRTRALGRAIEYLPEVNSTNDRLLASAAAGAQHGSACVTDLQLAGHGRLGRSWWAPAGEGLLFSVLLRPAIPLEHAGRLTMSMGLAAAAGVEETTGIRLGLKWPNDLMLSDKKVGGMLAQVNTQGSEWFAVLGLGINVDVDFSSAPPELRESATSLAGVAERPPDRPNMLAAILNHLESYVDSLEAGNDLASAWAARLDTLGREVQAHLLNDTVRGVAEGVSPEGALLIRTREGVLFAVWSGDVVHLR